ncbi:MAG: 4-(cytidine 5'-diphospho)-2-C-methyl-D-erythritol kinase [Bacteroidales bacterium]|nr:4-(cytidine 5'-diphospho)-2-C-methyl-D-erythritol kinase [Bacteroidales bacterium]
MILRTNVKLNLGLNVLRKRPDGYHDIETYFVPCHDFGDTMEVITGDDYSRTSAALFARYGDNISQRISPDGKLMITIAREKGVDWEPLKDLCAKAYFLLDKDFGLPPVKIFLEKKAPVGAGLGGGSADAAFTLKALNELCGLGLSDESLSEYASRLGSDCAFFIWNRPMIGTGRGEILEPFDVDLSGFEIKVIVPEGVSVSTAEAYRGIVPRHPSPSLPSPSQSAPSPEGSGATDASLRSAPPLVPLRSTPVPPLTVPRVACSAAPLPSGDGLKETLKRPVEEWKDLLVNDFEATVFKTHPELEAIKKSLYESGAIYATMSGSGSAMFAIYNK